MRRRTFAAVVATIAVAQLLVVGPVTARPPTTDGLEQDTNVAVEAETLSLDLDMATPQSVDGPVVFTATLSVDPGGGEIMYTIDSYEPMYEPVGAGGVTTVNLSGLMAGQHRVHVRFTGYGPYAATDVAIADFLLQRSSTTSLSVNRTTAFVGELPVVLTASVSTPDGDWAVTSVTLLDDVAGDVVEIGPLDLDQTTRAVTYSSNDLRIGVHSIRARYNAPWSTSPSVSEPVTVTVQADMAVHATFTRSMTTVYPYKDGVKDTMRFGGDLEEQATVTIRIYNSAGTRKRTWTLGTKPAGSYGVTWDGRTSGGTKLAAGKYKAVASFEDTLGHTKTVTTYVNLSWREATWKTGTVIAKYGDQFGYYADQTEDRLFLSPDHSRGRTMDAGPRHSCTTCPYIYGVKTFQLTTSGVGFRSIYATMYGHGYSDRDGTGDAFVVDPVDGSWDFRTYPPEFMQSGVTYNITIPATYVNASNQVRVILMMTGDDGDAWDLHALKLHYQYAVWK